MAFSIEKIARSYVYNRFPSASILEKEKIIRDWVNKERDARALVRDFKDRIFDPHGKKILDAGSGNGGVSIAFVEAGADVVGIDIEKELYDISIMHASSCNVFPKFILYDGKKIPLNDNSFDGAVSASVLEHTDDPEFYLHEILRVLKPGGMLYLGFPNKLAFRETHTQLLFLTYLPSFLRPWYVRFMKRNPLSDNNLHFYTYFALKRMLKKISSKNIQEYIWEIVPERGKSNNIIKKIIRSILNFFGIPYKAFLPHILVILKKVPRI